jgi:hypothetical protein
MPENQNQKKPDNRWWEFYFVRYFVGTALGAIVVLFLASANSPFFTSQGEIAHILKSLKPEKFESGYIAVLATVGLAFCYIASAPVLVLHALRGSLLKVRSNLNWKLVSSLIVSVLVIGGAQIYALWRAVQAHPMQNGDFFSAVFILVLVSLIFVGQLFLLKLSLFGGEDASFLYYEELASKRAAASDTAKEYIESYRHLREHGNAFLIALLELLLGAALFYSPLPWGIVLMFWIAPAAGVWFFGTVLESRKF